MTLLIFLILSFIFVKDSFAELYFEDTFSDNLLPKWDQPNSSENSFWQVSNGSLIGKANPDSSSLLHSKWNNSCLIGDYKVESEVINLSGVDQIFLVRVSNDKNDYYQIDYRFNELAHSVDNNNITICKIVNGEVVGDRIAVYPGEIKRNYDITQNTKHRIKIELRGNNILVYFDDKLAINYKDVDNPILCGGVSLLNWGGRCSVSTTNSYDFLKVSSLENDTNLPSKHKLIFIPGMGASWNTGAMVHEENAGSVEWKMTPFVKNYDSFFKALEENGLIKNQDYYVWNYDWRQPVAKIVENLNGFIDQKIENDKFSIVGHSMGGLAGRIWYQDHSSDQRLEKVVSVGSPQQGALDAYALWNSGKVLGRDDITSTALNILLALKSNKYCSKIEALQDFVPSVKDLIPVFNFTKTNGREMPYSQLASVNNYLKAMNANLSVIYDKFVPIVGTGVNTYEWIELDKRTMLDKAMGRWFDGRPVNLINGDGDGTVLVKSAYFPDDSYTSVFSGHGDLTSKGGDKVLEELGLGGSVDKTTYSLIGKKVYFIGSPAKMSVRCKGTSEVENDDQGFVLMDANSTDCIVKIVGTDHGTYHLVFGVIGNDNSYEYIENEIAPGEVDVYQQGQGNSAFWKKLLKRDMAILRQHFRSNKRLVNMMRSLDKNRLFDFLEDVKDFRAETEEKIISERLIRYIGKMLEESAQNANKYELRNIIMQERKRFLKLGEVDRVSRSNAYGFEMATKYLDKAMENLATNQMKQALADIYLAKSLTIGL